MAATSRRWGWALFGRKSPRNDGLYDDDDDDAGAAADDDDDDEEEEEEFRALNSSFLPAWGKARI